MAEGILLSSSEEMLKQIADIILLARPLIAHPAALPIIICGLYADSLGREIEMTWQETFHLETASEQSGLLMMNTSSGGTERSLTTGNPYGALWGLANLFKVFRRYMQERWNREENKRQTLVRNQRSIGLAQSALAWEKYTPDLVILVKRLEDFLRSDYGGAGGSEIQKAQRIALLHRVEFMIHDAEGMVERAKYLRSRLELQRSAVNDFMVLELARLSRREGSAMKYLALLGLVFLPSTAIAVSSSTLGHVEIGLRIMIEDEADDWRYFK